MCILKLINGHAEMLNFKNKYDTSMELSSDEVRILFYFNLIHVVSTYCMYIIYVCR